METRVRDRADVSAILLPIMSYRAYAARLQANKNAIHRSVKTDELSCRLPHGRTDYTPGHTGSSSMRDLPNDRYVLLLALFPRRAQRYALMS